MRLVALFLISPESGHGTGKDYIARLYSHISVLIAQGPSSTVSLATESFVLSLKQRKTAGN